MFAPFPLALFDEYGMRKTKKPCLYDIFQSISVENIDITNAKYVLDGDFNFTDLYGNYAKRSLNVCGLYISYVEKYFCLNTIIVFDEYYESVKNAKNSERPCRKLNIRCTYILFDTIVYGYNFRYKR